MAHTAQPGCLFCGIAAGDVAVQVVYDCAAAMAFADIAPKAPVHVLVIPKVHLADIGDLAGRPEVTVGFVDAISATAAEVGLSSYRTIFNTGVAAGQTVFHLHAHLLGGGDIGLGFDGG